MKKPLRILLSLIVVLSGSFGLLPLLAQAETVVPVVECVHDFGNGIFKVYFGYDNPNASVRLVQQGEDNVLQPHDPLQLPPQRFESGLPKTFPNSPYAVVFDGSPISWTLNGTTVTASQESPPCMVEGTMQIQIKPDEVFQTINGFGGAFALGFSKSMDAGRDDLVAAYNLEHLQPTHARLDLPLIRWEPVNDDDDSANFQWDRFLDSGRTHAQFELMQALDERGIVMIASVWDVPDWMVENPDVSRRRILAPGMFDEAIESIAAWLLTARDTYGLTVHAVSFNETNLGVNILFDDPLVYGELIQRATARFTELGLATKWLQGDASAMGAALPMAQPIWENETLRSSLGPLGLHSWDPTLPDERIRNIGDWANANNFEVWVTEAGFDAQAWETPEVFETWAYALQLARIYNRLYKLGRVSVPFYWQMVDDYRLVSQDGETPFPSFHVLKLFRENLPVGAQVVGSSRDVLNVYNLAAQSADHFMVSLVNASVNDHIVTLTGLPVGEYHHLRSSAGENAVLIDTYTVADGEFTLPLLAESMNVLTTLAP